MMGYRKFIDPLPEAEFGIKFHEDAEFALNRLNLVDNYVDLLGAFEKRPSSKFISGYKFMEKWLNNMWKEMKNKSEFKYLKPFKTEWEVIGNLVNFSLITSTQPC